VSVLVTGGAGYIGSHTVRRLLQSGQDVVVLDSLELGHHSAVKGASLIEGDIADESLVESLCREHRVESVVHFAAYKNVGESMTQPGRYWINNVAGTAHLVEAATRAGVDRFVFSSSCSVYGTPATAPVTEDAPIAPESVYAQSKAMVESMLQWYDATKGLRSVSLRYFNAAGASADAAIGEDWRYSLNLVPVVMKAALGVIPAVAVYGNDYPTPDGTCIRDYIHVDDLADAHVRALDHLAAGGTTTAVNVGTGVGTSVLEVIDATARISGRTVPYEIVARRPGDPVAVFADPARGEEVLGWRATLGLEEIIETAWRWHSTHLDGYG
jgi:UDP-glucose-4-epimerase GalE